jgi:hypothetical protein
VDNQEQMPRPVNRTLRRHPDTVVPTFAHGAPQEMVHLRNQAAPFSDETIESLVELGVVLEVIRKRLLADGYTVNKGKLIKVL